MFQNLLNKVGVGGLPRTFAYTVGDKVELPYQSIWQLHKGTKKADGSAVSVFVCPKKDIQQSTLSRAQNAEKVSKTLRYPNVLSALDSIEVDAGVYIVTEAVEPLLSAVEDSDGEVAAWGLYQALDALNFLHGNSFTHGLFGPASIFVTPRGDYRLAGFELCQKSADIHSMLAGRRQCGPCLTGWPDPPSALSDGGAPTLAVDYWGATVLVMYVFGSARSRRPGPDYRPDVSRAAQELPAELRQGFADLQKLGALKGRNPLADFIATPYFSNHPAITIMQFLGNLHIKSTEEREAFFEGLPALLEDVSKQTQTKQVLAELLDAQKFPGNESAQVLPAILKIGVKLPEEDFKNRVAPLVVQLFAAPDRAIRFRLLMSIGEMIDFLDEKIINDKIFPECVNGFSDSNAPIREATVKAMIHFAKKVKVSTLENRALKLLLKLLSDPEPSIRTNAIICCGRIATYLPKALACQSLLQAFTMGLKDPFNPCRSASLHTLMATATMFSNEDLACRLMPLICQRLVDPDPSVSSTAFDVLAGLQTHLKQQVEESRIAQQAAAEAAASSDGTPAAGVAAVGQQGVWGSWVSSSMGSFSTSAMGSKLLGSMGSTKSESNNSMASAGSGSQPEVPAASTSFSSTAPAQIAAPSPAAPPAAAAPRSGMSLGSAGGSAASRPAAPKAASPPAQKQPASAASGGDGSAWDDDDDFFAELTGDAAASKAASKPAPTPAPAPAPKIVPKAAPKPAAAPVVKATKLEGLEDDDFWKEFDS